MDPEMIGSRPPHQPRPPASAPNPAHDRNRVAGLWPAELLGLMGQAAQDYMRQVIHPRHDGLAEIRSRMAKLLGEDRPRRD